MRPFPIFSGHIDPISCSIKARRLMAVLVHVTQVPQPSVTSISTSHPTPLISAQSSHHTQTLSPTHPSVSPSSTKPDRELRTAIQEEAHSQTQPTHPTGLMSRNTCMQAGRHDGLLREVRGCSSSWCFAMHMLPGWLALGMMGALNKERYHNN